MMFLTHTGFSHKSHKFEAEWANVSHLYAVQIIILFDQRLSNEEYLKAKLHKKLAGAVKKKSTKRGSKKTNEDKWGLKLIGRDPLIKYRGGLGLFSLPSDWSN